MKKNIIIIIWLIIIGIVVAIMTKFSTTPPSPQQDLQLSGDVIFSGGNDITSWATDLLSGDSGEITSWTTQPTSWTPTNTQSNNPLVYTNTEFWFQLTLPKWWEDYKVFTYYNDTNNLASISITLPTKEQNRPWVFDPNDSNLLVSWYTWQYKYIRWYADMFGITIRSTQFYDNYQCEDNTTWYCITDGELLWKNEEFTYQLIWPHDYPIDIYPIWWNRKYFQQIIPTFKFL